MTWFLAIQSLMQMSGVPLNTVGRGSVTEQNVLSLPRDWLTS